VLFVTIGEVLVKCSCPPTSVFPLTVLAAAIVSQWIELFVSTFPLIVAVVRAVLPCDVDPGSAVIDRVARDHRRRIEHDVFAVIAETLTIYSSRTCQFCTAPPATRCLPTERSRPNHRRTYPAARRSCFPLAFTPNVHPVTCDGTVAPPSPFESPPSCHPYTT